MKPPKFVVVAVDGGPQFNPHSWKDVPNGTYVYRFVKEKRKTIAWVIKDKDDRYLYDPPCYGEKWTSDRVLSLRFASEKEALEVIADIDDELRARPVALVRKAPQ